MGDALTAVLLSKLLDRRGGGTSRRRAGTRKKPSKRRKSKTGKRSRSSFYVSKKLSCPKGYKTKYKTSKMRKCTRKRGSRKTGFAQVWKRQNSAWTGAPFQEMAMDPVLNPALSGPAAREWDPRFPDNVNDVGVGRGGGGNKRVRPEDEWMDDDEYVL